MKRVKQILAIIGVILLVGLYLSTFILAIFGDSNTMNLFKASIVATVIIPVLIWAYSMIYRLLKNHYSQREDLSDSSTAGTSREKDSGADTGSN